MNSHDELAPAGILEGPYQTIADERARINSARFRELGMTRSRRPLGNFLRRMALYPERIPKGNYHGMAPLPIRDLMDHIRLYARNGKPYAAIFHPYTRLDHELLTALVSWTAEVGLEATVDADSEYYPGVTLRITLRRPGTAERSENDKAEGKNFLAASLA